MQDWEIDEFLNSATDLEDVLKNLFDNNGEDDSQINEENEDV